LTTLASLHEGNMTLFNMNIYYIEIGFNMSCFTYALIDFKYSNNGMTKHNFKLIKTNIACNSSCKYKFIKIKSSSCEMTESNMKTMVWVFYEENITYNISKDSLTVVFM